MGLAVLWADFGGRTLVVQLAPFLRPQRLTLQEREQGAAPRAEFLADYRNVEAKPPNVERASYLRNANKLLA